MKHDRARFPISARSGLVMLAILTLVVGVGLPVVAQPKARTFLATGKTVSGRFLDYWSQNGELAQQGYPISEEFPEKSDTDGKTYVVQYFERAVFEHHPENQPPYDVLLSLLGNFYYKQKYPKGAPNQKASTVNPRVFPETGKTLGGRFRTYWENNGGLAQQGLPISDEFQEKSDLNGKTYTVQYFERAVFELHPENKPPFDVLLSQLGTFRFKAKYPQGEPTPPPAVLPTRVAGCESYLVPGTWAGPLQEQINFKGSDITGNGTLKGQLQMQVVCNGAFEGTATVTDFAFQAFQGRIPAMACSPAEPAVSAFNGKVVARYDGLHLLVSGGRWTQGRVVCKSPFFKDRTEELKNRMIDERDIKVETVSDGKITGSQWLANPVIDAVLAQVYEVDPNVQLDTTTSGHWEMLLQK